MGLLLIDIGRGTQDILLYRPGRTWENSIQLILPSPTELLAERVMAATARREQLLLTGETMGGGPLTKAVRAHLAAGGKVWATERSSASLDDDPDEVRAMGVSLVSEEEGRAFQSRQEIRTIRTGDVNAKRIEESLAGWGISFTIRAAAVAVQDHGRAPKGMSDRLFRFSRFREILKDSGNLAGLAYGSDNLPEYLTRMQGVKRSLADVERLLVMDTGFAALLGILADPKIEAGRRNLLLNVGNGHTLAGVVESGNLVALFEHHTLRLDAGSLSGWLDRLVSGSITDDEVYRSGGHGAYVREGTAFPGWEGIDSFAATGPRRAFASELEKRPYFAAPYGQMMLTGNCGLYRAFEEHWGPYQEAP